MTNPCSKLQFVDKSQTPKGFVVIAPVSGDIQSLNESDMPLLSSGVLGEGVLINLSGNKIVCPFDGVVTQIPPTLQQIQIKAKSGIKLLIVMPQGCGENHGHGFLPQVKTGQAVRAGQLLAHFNPQQMQSLPNQQTAVVITNAELLGGLYCSNKRVTAGEDILLTITAAKKNA